MTGTSSWPHHLIYYPKNNLSSLGSFKSFSICHAYKLVKLAHFPLASIEHTSTQPFKIIHSDVGVLAPILSFLFCAIC